jgi:hypothetical protein
MFFLMLIIFFLQIFWSGLAGLVAWWLTHSGLWVMGAMAVTSILVLIVCIFAFSLANVAGNLAKD